MASFMYEMALEPVKKVVNRVSDWDMSVYDDIEDFNLTADWSFAKQGRTAFI